MIADGLSLAVLTTIGFVIVYTKLPKFICRFFERFSLLTDILALVLTYMLFGRTLTALFAAAFTGLFVSGLLKIANNRKKFKPVIDAVSWASKQASAVSAAAEAYSDKYQEESKHQLHVVKEEKAS